MSSSELSNLLITLTLASSFLIIIGRRLDSVIKAAVVQGIVLAIFTAVRGWSTGMHEMYVAAVLTLLVKAGLIPYILNRVARLVDTGWGIKSYVNTKMSLVICVALVIVAYSVTGDMLASGSAVFARALPAALAMMLIGLFIMTTRKRAITQVVGLLVIENGVFMAGVGATNGMPAVIELGVFLDALAGVFIMAILAFRIKRAFATINTENLRSLRG
ncbi:MAG: hydrogenase [Peptococcaceae bacterium]|nr:hydrogenase [Peptococcaceae bacterium]